MTCLTGFTGCAILFGTAVGAGAVKYGAGELKAAENVTFERAWKASKRAIKKLNFHITDTSKDDLYGEIVARGAKDRKVVIKLKKQSDQVTEIGIRVGFFGDETTSRLILDEIKKYL